MQFHNWVKPEVISAHAVLLAAGRDNYSEKELQEQAHKLHQLYGTDIRMVAMPKFEVSSNQIRKCIKDHQTEDIREAVTEEVLNYILEHNLYR